MPVDFPIYMKKLRDDVHGYALLRRVCIQKSDETLHHAKRAIFSLHRHHRDEAEAKLRQVEELLHELGRQGEKEPRILYEGSYRAALEEYVEAQLFFQFVDQGKLQPITTIVIDTESFLAGLSDVPGELYRYAIGAATRGEGHVVASCHRVANDIVGELIEFDLTSYLRTKFDQAKQATHRIEEVMYDLAIREKKG